MGALLKTLKLLLGVITIFPVSILVTLMIILFLRFCQKKFGKLAACGFGFALGGFCALSFAAFNHRMSLDRFTDDPQNFISTSKFALMIATGLFACMAASLLLKQFRRPAPRIRHSNQSG